MRPEVRCTSQTATELTTETQPSNGRLSKHKSSRPYCRRILLNPTTPIPHSFETERFLIRRYATSDDEVLYQAARESIAKVFEFLPWCHPDYQKQDATDWLKTIAPSWKDGSAYNFGIFSKTDNEFYGGCGLNQINGHPIANLGYWTKTSSSGRGIATEATIGLARFCTKKLDLQRIEIVMSIQNGASKAVAEASGAQFEGRARNRLLLHGKRHDAFIYSITPADLKIELLPKLNNTKPHSHLMTNK